MDDKVSKYNIEVEYNKGILLYSTLINNTLPISFADYAIIEDIRALINFYGNKLSPYWYSMNIRAYKF